jgi:CheY-like chemotaxis protein
MLSKSATPRIVVLERDQGEADIISRQIKSLWAKSRVQVFRRGCDALEAIQAAMPDLFIAGVSIEDMDGLEHLEPFVGSNLPILVVTSGKAPRAFDQLRNLRYDGVFDAGAEDMGRLHRAMDDVMEHQLYLSSSIVPHIKKPKFGGG